MSKKYLITLRVGMTIPIVIVPGRLSGNGGEQMMTMMIGFKANVLAIVRVASIRSLEF